MTTPQQRRSALAMVALSVALFAPKAHADEALSTDKPLAQTCQEALGDLTTHNDRSFRRYLRSRKLHNRIHANQPAKPPCYNPETHLFVLREAIRLRKDSANARAVVRYFLQHDQENPLYRAELSGFFKERALKEAHQLRSITRKYKADVAPYRYMEPFEDLHRYQGFDPDHYTVFDVHSTLLESVSKRVELAIEERDFEGADALLHLLESNAEVQRAVFQNTNEEHRARSVYAQSQSHLEYERARFLFHYQRGNPNAIAALHTSLKIAERHAPIRTHLYRAALWGSQNQLLTLLIFLMHAVAIALVIRSRHFRTAGLRIKLARLDARDHSTEELWLLLARINALKEDFESLKAYGASKIYALAREKEDRSLQKETTHLLTEAEHHSLGGIWSSPQSFLQHMETSLDHQGSSAETLAHDLNTFSVLFPKNEKLLHYAQALHREASFRENAQTLAALQDLEDLYRKGPRLAGQRRLGILYSEYGPSLMGHEAWKKSFSALFPNGIVSLTPIEKDHKLHLAQLFSVTGAPRLSVALQGLTGYSVQSTYYAETLLALAEGASLPSIPTHLAPEQQEELLTEHRLSLRDLGLLLSNPQLAACDPEKLILARLKVALLHRMLQTHSPQGSTEDLQNLFAEAEHHTTPRVKALASMLDLLVEGDHGFDHLVDSARGDLKVLLQHLDALNHYVQGETLKAASILAEILPETDVDNDALQLRLWMTRAALANSIHRHRAAEEALLNAHKVARTPQEHAAVEAQASRMLGWAMADPGARALLLELACLGWLRRKDDAPPVSWLHMADQASRFGTKDTAALLLQRSNTEEKREKPQEVRRQIVDRLVRKALQSGDYTRARSYAILSEAQSPGMTC